MYSFEITFPDKGTQELKVSLGDLRVWERKTGKKIKQLDEGNFELEDLFIMAYSASVRRGFFTGTEEEFETVVDIEFSEVPAEDPKAGAKAA